MADLAALAVKGKELLDALPNEKDSIAALFRDRGIAGLRWEACECPVARYLRSELELGDEIRVSWWDRATLGPADIDGSLDYLDVEIRPDNRAVQQFAVDFDAGLYPALEVE